MMKMIFPVLISSLCLALAARADAQNNSNDAQKAADTAATAPDKRIVGHVQFPDKGVERYVVADRGLTRLLWEAKRVCQEYARSRAAYDAEYGDAATTTKPESSEGAADESLRAMSRAGAAIEALAQVNRHANACDMTRKAFNSQLDAILGQGAAARYQSGIPFEGKVYLTLALPPKPKPASDDAETWKLIEEGWKNGANCP